MVINNGLVYFGKATADGIRGIVAILAMREIHIPISFCQEHDKNLIDFFSGVMQQAMRHNTIVSFTDSWAILESTWTINEINTYPVILV